MHPPGLHQRLLERIRGREQLLVRPRAGYPLLLLTYPRGKQSVAREVEEAVAHTLPRLPGELLKPYAATLAALPAMVVVLLRPENTCGCLGHFHHPGTESRLAKRLTTELGSYVAEMDLAYEGIRRWKPDPIALLETGDLGGRLPALHFRATLLAVLLHELEHVAFPAKQESGIRAASNDFYRKVMEELVRDESGKDYGIISEDR